MSNNEMKQNTKKKLKNLHVRDLNTREIVHTISVSNPSQVGRVIAGMLINMNTDKYFVDDSEFYSPGEEK